CLDSLYLSAKIRSFEWGLKVKRRKTTGSGCMHHLKGVSRHFKNGFRCVPAVLPSFHFLIHPSLVCSGRKNTSAVKRKPASLSKLPSPLVTLPRRLRTSFSSMLHHSRSISKWPVVS
ncbi:hypothetical protein DFH11DRAFT_1513463, partial [Phellopilus nigrolimitatus]